MKNYVQLNSIIADFTRIDTVLLKYKALYFTYPTQKHDFNHIYPLACLVIVK